MAPVAVFDLDGTLVDTAPDLAASLNACLAAAKLSPASLDEVRPHAGHGARVMLQQAYGRAGRPLDEAELTRQLEVFLAHYEAHICDLSKPFPGVVAAMDRLEAGGYVLAVCTNKFEHLSIKLLDALGLSGRFAAICGADTFSRRKPDPIHLLGTIERANAAWAEAKPGDKNGAGRAPERSERSGDGRHDGRPHAAFLVGDTATDTDAAIAASVPSILVDFGYAPDERARRDADVVIATYDDLDAALADRLIARTPMVPPS